MLPQIGQQLLFPVGKALVQHCLKAVLQRRADRPSPQPQRQQVVSVDRQLFQGKAVLLRQQAVQHLLYPGVLRQTVAAPGRLSPGIRQMQLDQPPEGPLSQTAQQPPDRLALRRDGQVVVADQLQDLLPPGVVQPQPPQDVLRQLRAALGMSDEIS